mmetsp:Transcript_31698/g.47506  ORF Transcript_31698/g.47506 Transcript_31698/m.47506 type:complete len:267 (+) Transcript_31698:2088-2888(+)
MRMMIRRMSLQREVLESALGPLHRLHHHQRRMLRLVLAKVLLHLGLMKTKVTLPTLERLNLAQLQVNQSQNEDVVATKRMISKMVERRRQVLALDFHLVRLLPKTRQLRQHPLRLGQPAKKTMCRRRRLPHLHSEVLHLRRRLTMRQLRSHLDPLLPLRKRKQPQHRLARQASLSVNQLRVRVPLHQLQKRKSPRFRLVKQQVQLLHLRRRTTLHQLPLLLLPSEQLHHLLPPKRPHRLQLSNLARKLLLRLLQHRHLYLVDQALV